MRIGVHAMIASPVLGLLVLSAPASSQPTGVAAFVNVALVPMDRERVVPSQTVVVRGGRIDEIGPADTVEVPDGAMVVDGRGRYLIPGLADMHAHLPAPPTPQDVIDSVLFLFVANGVTTVRGMMGHPSHTGLRDRVARDEVLGPTLYVAGPPLESRSVTDAETARTVVREQAVEGFDFIKVIDVNAEAYNAIIETADDLDIPVVGHVPRAVGILGALGLGQVSVEHLDGYLEAAEADDSPIRDADFTTRSRQLPLVVDTTKFPRLVMETRDSGTWNVPTLALYETFLAPDRGEALKLERPEVRYLPPETVEEWVTLKNEFLDNPTRNVMGFAVTGPGVSRLLALRKEMVQALHDGGARLILGTDALQLFMVPGFSVHREMVLLVESGLSPYQVLELGTRNVAEYLGQLSEVGTIAAGKRADLLLLEANPLEDIGNVLRRSGVMVRGNWVSEAEIQSHLERIAESGGSDRRHASWPSGGR
ncbi:MAG: amidohydrolase family protein [Acidobacteria bacterium]|nr:amidohydrolase family protein [Acidobacteriota bacterium]